MTKIRGVIGIIIDQATKNVLLTKRPLRKEFFPGYWECPGGKVESQDHSLKDALAREMFEELGIVVKKSDYLTDVESNIHLLSVFVVSQFEGTPRIREDQLDMGWFTIDQAIKMQVPPLTITLLEQYRSQHTKFCQL
jgi:8-oxo-dGTP diphosphatase